jgi:ankyrin repeat protein/regulator of sirC expression with transglutaminase-like and TPR domain
MPIINKSIMFRSLTALVLTTALAVAAHAAPDIDPAVAKGKALISQKKFSEAVTELNAVLTANPRNVEALRQLGIAHRNLSQLDAALSDFTKALELEPKSYASFAGRALTKRQANNIPGAVEDMEAAVRLSPPPKDAANLLMILFAYYKDSGNKPAMVDACVRAKQAEVNTGTVNCAGWAYLRNGQYDKAVQEFDQLVQLNSTLFYAYTGRGKAYLELGRLDKARRDFDKVAELKPDIMKLPDVQADIAKLSALEKGEKPPTAAPAPAPAPIAAAKPVPATAAVNPALNKELHDAVAKKDVGAARAALDKGADVNSPAPNAYTPLLNALVMTQQTEMAAMLLSRGADPNKGTYDGFMPLMRAASEGYADIFKTLLDKGADVNKRTKAGLTALIAAAMHGRTELVRTLLDKGADVNVAMTEQGDTALLSAARSNNPETVKLLLERGAPVNQRMKDGNTSLMLAAHTGAECQGDCKYAGVLQVLLAGGADVQMKNNQNETALLRACCADEDSPDIVKVLLDKGADANDKRPNGESILMCAAERGNRDTVRVLLARGSDPNARMQDGMTAIKKTVKRWGWQADEIVKMLKAAGATE